MRRIRQRDPAVSAADSMVALRNSVRRDLEALLNARRRWRSWPTHMTQLGDVADRLRHPGFRLGRVQRRAPARGTAAEIEETIRRFEPRFLSVRVHLIDTQDRLETTLRLRIEAVLHAEPAPEAVTFDTLVDPTTDEVRGAARQS